MDLMLDYDLPMEKPKIPVRVILNNKTLSIFGLNVKNSINIYIKFS